LSIPFIHSSKNLITFNSNRFRLKKQVFYVKKEEKLSNVYHKSKPENQSTFQENMKNNEIKACLTKGSNLFFQGMSVKIVKNNQSETCLLSG